MFGVHRPAVRGRWMRVAAGVIIGLCSASFAQAQAAPAPAQGQPAAQAQSGPTVRTFGPDGGLVLLFVKPDKTMQFETVMGKLKDALQKSDKPERKQQAESWKLFKSADQAAGGNALYIFIIDPAVKGADYTVGNIIFDAYPAEAQAIYKEFADSLAQGMNIVNLALVQDFAK